MFRNCIIVAKLTVNIYKASVHKGSTSKWLNGDIGGRSVTLKLIRGAGNNGPLLIFL